MRSASEVTVLICILALLSACSGSSHVDEQGFITSYCAELTPCCASAGRPADGARCRSFVTVSDLLIPQDKAKQDACIAGLRAAMSAGLGCNRAVDDVAQSLLGAKLIPCYGAAPGDPCEKDADCALSADGPVICALGALTDDAVNRCQVQLEGRLGDACIATKNGDHVEPFMPLGLPSLPPRGYVCDTANGLYCDLTSWSCAAQLSVGAACYGAATCGPGSYCNQNQCAPSAAHGSACEPLSCVSTDYCDLTSRTCVTKLADGSSCSLSDMCSSGMCLENPHRCLPSDYYDTTKESLQQICGP